MQANHVVIIIPGLGDRAWGLRMATRGWKSLGIMPVIHTFGWKRNDEAFTSKLNRLITEIDRYTSDGKTVSLLGTSAGGSAALNAFSLRKTHIHRVINVCGRLRVSTKTGIHGFDHRTSASPSFRESVIQCERNEKMLSQKDRKKFLTIRPLFGDELVPKDAVSIKGAKNISILMFGHVVGIASVFMVYKSVLISFIRN